jgi:hypothetical protein
MFSGLFSGRSFLKHCPKLAERHTLPATDTAWFKMMAEASPPSVSFEGESASLIHVVPPVEHRCRGQAILLWRSEAEVF